MPIYTGKGIPGEEGFEMKEFEGVYTNPDNDNEWSSKPYPKQKQVINTKNAVMDYMNGKYTLDDVYKQIQDKVCKLPFRLRKYVLSHYNDKGEFIEID